MSTVVIAKASAWWALILSFAVLNGAVREKLWFAWLGVQPGMMLSGILLSACIIAVAWQAAPRYGALTARTHAGIGAFWLALTLIFEFGIGLGVQGKQLSEMLSAFTFTNANLWPLVLAVTAGAPWAVARWRRLI